MAQNQQTEDRDHTSVPETEASDSLRTSSLPKRFTTGTLLKFVTLTCAMFAFRQQLEDFADGIGDQYDAIGSVDMNLDSLGVDIVREQSYRLAGDTLVNHLSRNYSRTHTAFAQMVGHDFVADPNERVLEALDQIYRDTLPYKPTWHDQFDVYEYLERHFELIERELDEDSYRRHYDSYVQETESWELTLEHYKESLLERVGRQVGVEKDEVLAYTEQEWQEKHGEYAASIELVPLNYEQFRFVIDSLRFFKREYRDSVDPRLIGKEIYEELSPEEIASNQMVVLEIFEKYFDEVLHNYPKLFEQYGVTSQEIQDEMLQAIYDARRERRVWDTTKHAALTGFFGIAVAFLSVWTFMPRFMPWNRGKKDYESTTKPSEE